MFIQLGKADKEKTQKKYLRWQTQKSRVKSYFVELQNKIALFEQLGNIYHRENGYLISDLRLPGEEEQQLKAGNALKWIGRMNEKQAMAREIANTGRIYT